MSHSLRRNLNRRILGAMSIFALLASIVSGVTAFNEAREMQDNLLRQVASLMDLHTSGIGSLGQDGDPEDSLVLQRFGETSVNSLPIPTDLNDGFHTIELQGVDWRVFVYSSQPAGIRSAVSQQIEVRDEIAFNNSLHTLLPVLLLAPILMAIVSFAVEQSVKPIIDFADVLDQGESNLKMLPDDSAPEEISPFITSINRLLNRLQRTINQQRRFVADAAHELRTPVAGLSLLAENLVRATTLEEMQQRMIPLQNGLNRIQDLVGQLLDLARLQGESNNVTLRVNLQCIVQEVIAELYPLAEKKSIDLGMPINESLQVMDMSGNLRILLHNAIDNAIRYTPNGGRIDVSVFTELDMAVIVVKDSGIGIPEEELAHVFEPFYRADVNAEPGNGLGLAIIKEIAVRLGGVVTLSNLPEGGLRFCYSQPLSVDS